MSLKSSPATFAATALPDVGTLEDLDQSQLRTLAQSLIERIALDSKHSTHRESKLQSELLLRQAKIEALTVEIRLLRHLRFAAKTETMDAVQVKLFEEANAEDVGAAQHQLAQLGIQSAPAANKRRPARQPLPASPAWTLPMSQTTPPVVAASPCAASAKMSLNGCTCGRCHEFDLDGQDESHQTAGLSHRCTDALAHASQ